MDFIGEIKNTIDQAKATDAINPLATTLEAALEQLGETATVIGRQAVSPKYKIAFASAHPFMMAMGDVIMGWMLLWRAAVSAPKLEKIIDGMDEEKRPATLERNKNAAFYDGQIQSARYFINAVLPITLGRLAGVRAGDEAILEITERGFGGV